MNFRYGSHTVILVSVCTFCSFASQKNQLAILMDAPLNFVPWEKFFSSVES